MIFLMCLHVLLHHLPLLLPIQWLYAAIQITERDVILCLFKEAQKLQAQTILYKMEMFKKHRSNSNSLRYNKPSKSLYTQNSSPHKGLLIQETKQYFIILQ
ncbi:hypothetical protein C0J52_07789 [Blattella germanica]|nr:hypothetical protein C0J52_07789 [Blattella germanica]